MKYLTFTHPQKKIPVFVAEDSIIAVEPMYFHYKMPIFEDGYEIPEDGQYDAEKIIDEKDVFEFLYTELKLKDRTAVCVRERPQSVQRKMRKAGLGFVD